MCAINIDVRTVGDVIGYIVGEALDSQTILTAAGVGYRIITPLGLTPGNNYQLWVHTAVSDTAITCYGFSNIEQKELFHALCKVPGVGGKLACDILAAGEADEVAAKLAAKDEIWLTTIKGVGKAKATKLLANLTLPAHLGKTVTTSTEAAIVTTGDDLADTLIDLTGTDSVTALATIALIREKYGNESEDIILREALLSINRKGNS